MLDHFSFLQQCLGQEVLFYLLSHSASLLYKITPSSSPLHTVISIFKQSSLHLPSSPRFYFTPLLPYIGRSLEDTSIRIPYTTSTTPRRLASATRDSATHQRIPLPWSPRRVGAAASAGHSPSWKSPQGSCHRSYHPLTHARAFQILWEMELKDKFI